MNKILLITLTMCSVLFKISAQKTVHLIHGLGGSENSWKSLENKINNNCSSDNVVVYNYSLTEESAEGVQPYSEAISSSIGSNGTFNDIAIGHSAGGFTLRYLDVQESSNQFGGYFTVGAAHNGALFSNSYDNDDLSAFGLQLCSTIDNALEDFEDLDEHIPITGLSDFLGRSFKKLSKLREIMLCLESLSSAINSQGCSSIIENLLSEKNEQVAGFIGQTATDAAKGGLVQGLAPAQRPAYGIQTSVASPVHWKLINHLIENGGGTELPLNCTAEGTFLETIASLQNDLVLVNITISLHQDNFFLSKKTKRALSYLKRSITALLRFLDNSEFIWQKLIGSRTVTEITTIYEEEYVPLFEPCMVTPDGGGEGCLDGFECHKNWCIPVGEDPCQAPYGYVTFTHVTYSVSPDTGSDGLIPVPDQVLPGGLENGIGDALLVRGPSHFEQPGDKLVHAKINERCQSGYMGPDVFRLQNCNF